MKLLTLMCLVFAGLSTSFAQLPDAFEDPSVTGINGLKPHATVFPFKTKALAMKDNITSSANAGE